MCTSEYFILSTSIQRLLAIPIFNSLTEHSMRLHILNTNRPQTKKSVNANRIYLGVVSKRNVMPNWWAKEGLWMK